MTDNICATVILYNPDESIFDNIDSYINEVEKLFIVDNSEVSHAKIIQKLHENYSNIEYIFNGENLGIATALNIACDKATQQHYKWILTMDQDSQFFNFKDFFSCVTQTIQTDTNIGLIAPNHTGHKNIDLSDKQCNYIEKELVITSGNIINLQHFNSVGRFDDKLFIDMVDYDFSHKLIENNFKILLLEKHYILHHIGEVFARRNILTGKIKSKIEHNPQRVYYMTRNRLYLSRKYAKLFPKEYNIFKTLNILFIHDITKILLYEDKKLQKLFAKNLALFHFIISKMGKHTL